MSAYDVGGRLWNDLSDDFHREGTPTTRNIGKGSVGAAVGLAATAVGVPHVAAHVAGAVVSDQVSDEFATAVGAEVLAAGVMVGTIALSIVAAPFIAGALLWSALTTPSDLKP